MIEAPKHRLGRAKSTTGARMFAEGGDGRSRWARRFSDLTIAITRDATAAGAVLSELDRQLIRRAATLSVEAERLESELSSGKEISFKTYTALTATVSRIERRLGIVRRKPVAAKPHDLAAHLAAKRAAAR